MVVGSGCWLVGRSSRILHHHDRLARSPNLSRSCALRAYRPLRSVKLRSWRGSRPRRRPGLRPRHRSPAEGNISSRVLSHSRKGRPSPRSPSSPLTSRSSLRRWRISHWASRSPLASKSPQDRTTVLKNYSLAFFVSFVYFVVSLRHRMVRRMLSMGTSIAARKPLLALGLLFFFSLGRFPAAAQDQKPMGSWIELIGRSDKEPPPQVWHLEDAKTKKKVASVDSRWGFTPLPPGQYR